MCCMESNTFVDLLRYAFLRKTVGGVECAVVAVGTAATRKATVAVGAGEAGVDGDLLHTPTEGALEVGGVGVEAATADKHCPCTMRCVVVGHDIF